MKEMQEEMSFGRGRCSKENEEEFELPLSDKEAILEIKLRLSRN